MGKYKIVATPCHKEVPRSDLAESVDCSDQYLHETLGALSAVAVANVRKAGHDMRDDWTIVLSFKSAR